MPDADPTASHKSVIVGGVVGNIMEWYDFAVYGYFASVLAPKFFPTGDAASSLVAAFGAFAAGFLMRPVGGVVFGHIGDRIGRKAALTLSVAMMAVPSVLIGLLPTHETIGIWAAVLMVIPPKINGSEKWNFLVNPTEEIRHEEIALHRLADSGHPQAG